MIAVKEAPFLLEDRDGATAVEFALISPVLVLLLMGLFDIGFSVYANTMLQGALQRAARSSTVEGAAGSLASIDSAVATEIHPVVPEAALVFSRKAYANFTDVGLPEDFTDSNGNGACDAGEPYEDANGSGTWDRDRGAAGLGGARDAVLYTVTMTYTRKFPMASLIGMSETVTNKASTILRNQPYDEQKSVAKLGNCT
ncbi:TadE/TadG family type IV pilus assembly protein [Novosphingobium taihuense]|uniref:Flp pilus assembly protein TadG n=1 Tax=Novosphingobium taihuense TaxID=260085 RepID=A0A7W7AB80_9SPHN|nr:TadE/TadG family type IV pilus assembly protein [Novosphingobium taihuense]MBB4613810.1 Flp pilus assembly protein TadG [Novosphingobium taihuense]TWH83318.1 TadE-like protein [Novosphingobium taihuense]